MTPPFDPYSVTPAGELQREEAQVASLQRVRPSTHMGAWTALCLFGAVVAEVVYRLT